jgi:hypothetical protein
VRVTYADGRSEVRSADSFDKRPGQRPRSSTAELRATLRRLSWALREGSPHAAELEAEVDRMLDM